MDVCTEQNEVGVPVFITLPPDVCTVDIMMNLMQQLPQSS